MRPDSPPAQTGAEPWLDEGPRPAAPAPEDAHATRPAVVAGPPTRLIALLEVLLCSGLPTQILVLAALVTVGFLPTTDSARLSLPGVTALLSIDALLLVVLIVYFLGRHGERPRQVFLGRRGLFREALLGLVLTGPVLMTASALIVGLRAAWPWLQTVAENPLAQLLDTPRDAWIFGTVAVLAGGVREELQRAFVLHRFGQGLGGSLAGLVVFSLVFGAGHSMQGIDVAVTTAALGAMWGAVYLWRQSAVAPIVCHAAFNALEVLRYRMLP